MTFANAINSTPKKTRTTNGMVTNKSSLSAAVDLFFQIGAARNQSAQQIAGLFAKAYGEDPIVATKILFYARDIRGGAGERKVFRNIMLHLERMNPDLVKGLLPLVPEYGRWDDLLIFSTPEVKNVAYEVIRVGLFEEANGLCGKWMPRKGPVAADLRNFLGLSPKQYRKTLVALSDTVEQKMCAGQWSEINYSHVPSVAAKRLQKAFKRNDTERYAAYVDALTKGVKGVKINASAIFPHDVLKGLYSAYSWRGNAPVDTRLIKAQWDALPNYLAEGASILPMIDTSGSMGCTVGGTTTAIEVAVALGLYVAEKNKGAFHGVWLNFNSNSHLKKLNGDIVSMAQSLYHDNDWGGSTNLESAFNAVLNTAIAGNVSQEDMPKTILIMSDMQFNQCVSNANASAMQMIKQKYQRAGYELPNVVFWNLNAHANQSPALQGDTGVALVSGYSPAILSTILGADPEEFTPRSIMLKKLNDERYNPVEAATLTVLG